jgi:circadian clock protein KaiC
MVVFDPITNLISVGNDMEVGAMLTRLIDFLKSHQITAIFNSLTSGGSAADQSEAGVSSLMDTWLLVRNLEAGGERNRALYILKSRGMPHSNQVREFVITDRGLDLIEPYLGDNVVLTGSARIAQESRERNEALALEQTAQRRARDSERKRLQLKAQLSVLEAEMQALDEDSSVSRKQEEQRRAVTERNRARMSVARGGNGTAFSGGKA